MKPRHPKYKIKPNDTLQRITELFGIEETIWKRYHDNMCTLDDVIRDNLPTHLKEIYLLPELWEKEDELNFTYIVEEKVKLNKKTPLGYKNTLPFRAIHISKKYGVNIEIETIVDQISKSQTIDYNLSLQWYLDEEDKYVVEITKISETYVDKESPDLMMDKLSIESFDTLYPIKFVINGGGIVSLYNLKEIKVRWEKAKPHLRDKWKGDWVEKYFRLIDNSLSTSFGFMKKMRKDWFLYCFFFNIRKTYGDTYQLEEEIAYPFSSQIDEELKYTTQQKVDEYRDNNDRIQVNIKGEIVNDIPRKYIHLTKKGNINFENRPTGSYFARYYVNSQNYMIESCRTRCSLKSEIEKIITVSVSSF